MKRKKMSKLQRKEARYGYLFILPWLIGFVALFLFPLVTSIRYAFSDVSFTPTGVITEFVGFKNFITPFEDVNFISNTFTPGMTSFLYETALVCIFSLFIAIILNQKFHGRIFARALFFLPVIIASGVVIQVLRRNGMNTDLETENTFVFNSGGLLVILDSIGFPSQIAAVFQEISNRIFDIVWLSGIQIILYLSGLQSIPSSEYEAAQMEGATGWECFWKITWPRITPMTLVVVVYTIIDSFTNISNPVIGWTYDQYVNSRLGISSAMGWTVCMITFVVLIVVGGFISKHVFYINDEA